MLNNEPTQPGLRAQNAPTQSGLMARQAGAPPSWPPPQREAAPVPRRTERWLLRMLAGLVLFGVGSGVMLLIAHGNTLIGPSTGGPGLRPSTAPLPTTPPTSAPLVNPPRHSATPISTLTVPPEPTPTSGGGD